MRLDYYYQKTETVEKYLQNWLVLKKVIDLLPKLPHLEENLRRKSLLKSALYSAKIEGNRLNMEDLNISPVNPQNQERKEIYNILQALKGISTGDTPLNLSKDYILKLHELVMQNISPEAGSFRTENSAIFNQAGVAVYMTPPPSQIGSLIGQFIEKINNSSDPGPINAAVSHFIFEKIHPFLDGNGRVGRLISTYILKKKDDDFHGLISFEENINKNRENYYRLLSSNHKDITSFVEFFLEILNSEAERIVKSIKDIDSERPEDTLLPRRREILEIIKDHQIISFDEISRRFYKIPASSLHYDLKMLLRDRFIKKLGTTRGTLYSPR